MSQEVKTIMRKRCSFLLIGILIAATGCSTSAPLSEEPASSDPYAKYVWPAPPDKPRIRLTAIIHGRADVEGRSALSKTLIGANPSPYDLLEKPFSVKFDRKGRILVSDPALAALFRIDQELRRMDVFGTAGSTRLKMPLGIAVGADGTIYVADAGLQKIVAFDEEGAVKGVIGKAGDLVNPTGVALSPDQNRIFVADSKGHRIVVFDVRSGAVVMSFGKRGEAEGEFSFPTSLVFSGAGELVVVDQLNARIQVFTQEGEFVDAFGSVGTRFGNFVRPKDIALDDEGLFYISDAAFGNVQIFNRELQLLTFVGENGTQPGQFQIAAGVAIRGGELAVADQVGKRVQLFRFIAPKGD